MWRGIIVIILSICINITVIYFVFFVIAVIVIISIVTIFIIIIIILATTPIIILIVCVIILVVYIPASSLWERQGLARRLAADIPGKSHWLDESSGELPMFGYLLGVTREIHLEVRPKF